MKSIFFVLIFFWTSFFSFTQVTNGGFETVDNTPLPAPNNYAYSINHAVGWYNLKNTCDLGGIPGYNMVTSPYLGTHNAGVGYPPNGSNEYFYGKTASLTAGQNYLVSFWAKSDATDNFSIPIGVYFSTSLPSETAISSVTPQMKYTPTSNQYEKVEFCFTPTQSGVYNIIFGNYTSVTVTTPTYYFIDEVSMSPFNGPFATANPTIPNTTVCVGSDVIIDGTTSQNETAYEWDIYEVVSGTEILKYNGIKQLGQAGTFNASSTLSSLGIQPVEGKTYKVYLTVYNGCSDIESVQFTYEKPIVQFLNSTNPICEGSPLTLSVSGDNGWMYSWSTGQTGVGVKIVTVNPLITVSHYTVTVTTILGCTHTEAVDFVIHSANNQAPSMNGINGSGEYVAYVNSESSLSFFSNLSNDNVSENVSFSYNLTGLPASYYNLVNPLNNNGVMSFTWNTGTGMYPTVSPGTYTFSVTISDNNACGSKSNTYVYTIIVVCDHCPLIIDYENRTPSSVPLPNLTEVGQKIIAGNTQIVETGTANVVFQAGQTIELGPNFSAGAGFLGNILPSSCVTDCQSCCTDWTGFTADPITTGHPDGYYHLNLGDAQFANDLYKCKQYFEVLDLDHPFCAYGAVGYSLDIYDRVDKSAPGNLCHKEYNINLASNTCCQFSSVAPENQIPYSSIWWDGYVLNTWGNFVPYNGINAWYKVVLYSCNGQSIIYEGVITFDHWTLAKNLEIENTVLPQENISNKIVNNSQTISTNEALFLNTNIFLAPNPAEDIILIHGIADYNKLKVQLFDNKGQMIVGEVKLDRGQFDVSFLVKGFYYCRINIGEESVIKKFVKL